MSSFYNKIIVFLYFYVIIMLGEKNEKKYYFNMSYNIEFYDYRIYHLSK